MDLSHLTLPMKYDRADTTKSATKCTSGLHSEVSISMFYHYLNRHIIMILSAPGAEATGATGGAGTVHQQINVNLSYN